jgi:antirestriction protein
MNQAQPPAAELPPATTAADRATETEPTVQPQIWVASLIDYDRGTVHGVCLDAAQDEAALQAAIDTMLAASPQAAATGEPAEEWAIQDYTGFGPLRIDRRESLRWISLVGKGIAQHGLAFAAYADVVEEEAYLACFEDDYLGHYDSVHTYLEQLVNDMAYDRILDEVVSPAVRPYVKIDIAGTAQDLLMGDLHALPATDGGVWLFR